MTWRHKAALSINGASPHDFEEVIVPSAMTAEFLVFALELHGAIALCMCLLMASTI